MWKKQRERKNTAELHSKSQYNKSYQQGAAKFSVSRSSVRDVSRLAHAKNFQVVGVALVKAHSGGGLEKHKLSS